jgi:hypothetical protein
MAASMAENLRVEGGVLLTEKALCKDCGAYVYRHHLIQLSGEWTQRAPKDAGQRTYACVALRQKSA